MTLTIKYNNGNVLTQKVNYLHMENGTLFYTMDTNPHAVVQDIVKIPLSNVSEFDLEKGE